MLKVIIFGGSWCPPCTQLEKMLPRIEEKFKDEVEFEHIDIDADPDTTAEHNISSVPTMVFVQDGKPIDTIVGLVRQNVIEDKISALK